ncbi:hypothetical protein U9M48_020485 [Paspalum notatum var. saurae]|uniref:Uncharacterized protein n=1 Tax=Paspalum notatum var. saurae TaxID=547442 RepID=A0AAQ3TEV0_PASNO
MHMSSSPALPLVVVVLRVRAAYRTRGTLCWPSSMASPQILQASSTRGSETVAAASRTAARCSNRTGHVHKLQLAGTGSEVDRDETALVGQISPSLLALEHLEHLDLSNNQLEGSTGRLPEFMGSLKSLKYLNLSGIPFYGVVPPQLGNLSKLHYLDLSSIGLTNSADLLWLTRLPSLQYLNLNNLELSTAVDWAHVMNMIPSLRILLLSDCSLASANQSLPHLNLTNLEELDASSNSFNHPMATEHNKPQIPLP